MTSSTGNQITIVVPDTKLDKEDVERIRCSACNHEVSIGKRAANLSSEVICTACGQRYHVYHIPYEAAEMLRSLAALTESAPIERTKTTRSQTPGRAQTSTLADGIRATVNYRAWRWAVLLRDNFTCQKCSTRSSRLDAHHIRSLAGLLQEFTISNVEAALECRALWDVGNGQALCRTCHRGTHAR